MKILKRPNTNWSYKHTCSQCDAELEVEKGDVYYAAHDAGPGPSESWSAYCPICTQCISIPKSDIPKAVQVEIKDNVDDR